MADSTIDGLAALASTDVTTSDLLVIQDSSATATKKITTAALRDWLGANGAVRVSFGTIADGAVNNGEAYLSIDTASSPVTVTLKARDTGGNLIVKVL